MKMVNIIKLTSSAGKIKFLSDFLEASFHIQSNNNGSTGYNLESVPALFSENTYYALTKVTDKHEGLADLQRNMLHHAYRIYVETSDGGGSGFGKSEGYDLITTSPYVSCNGYRRGVVAIFIDENEIPYQQGNAIQLEKSTVEFDEIKPVIHAALDKAIHRKAFEYNQASTLFTKRKRELLEAEREIVRQRAELELEEKRFEM